MKHVWSTLNNSWAMPLIDFKIMNEHIKQIAEQAGFDVYGWNEKEF